MDRFRHVGKLLSILPHLTHLEIGSCDFHDDFYKEIVDRAFSSKIQTVDLNFSVFRFVHLSIKKINQYQQRPIQTVNLDFMVFGGGLIKELSHSASKHLAKFLCSLPCLTTLTIRGNDYLHDFYTELGSIAASSQIQTVNLDFMVFGGGLIKELSHSASKHLAKFLCSLPCLTTLTIRGSEYLHDDFYTELGSIAASSQIQTVSLDFHSYDKLGSPACKQLAKFLCSLPCLSTLAISGIVYLHDDFFTELGSLAASSQIQTVDLDWCYYTVVKKLSHSASKQLAKFLCSLPCLTTLTITGSEYLHDDFYTELGSIAASSQIQTVSLDFNSYDKLGSPACKQLAKFLCSLPCLSTLAISGIVYLHDDFFTELGSLAASSQIQTVSLDFNSYDKLGSPACKQLAKFLCSLPCLTTLTIRGSEYLHDDFYTELGSIAASSQNPYFRERKHISLLQKWSPRKDHRQKQQLMISTHQEPLNLDMPSTSGSISTQCRKDAARPSGQFQSDPHRGIQSEPEQIDQSTTYQQHSPIMPFQSTYAPDQLTKQHLEEFDLYLQSYLSAQHNASNGHATQYSANLSSQETQHSPHHGLGEATQATAVSQRQEDATPIETDHTLLSSSSEYINYLTSVYQGGLSIGMKPIYENDDNLAMPSTSGLSSAKSRTDGAPVESERIPEHRKRIHSDDDDDDDGGDGHRVDESLEQRPGKRRAKTDRQPTSP